MPETLVILDLVVSVGLNLVEPFLNEVTQKELSIFIRFKLTIAMRQSLCSLDQHIAILPFPTGHSSTPKTLHRRIMIIITCPLLVPER